MSKSIRVVLNKGREKSLERRHQWVFEGAINHVEGEPETGDSVDVVSAGGAFLGRGLWSPQSQIRVRIFTWDSDVLCDEQLIREKIIKSVQRRSDRWENKPNSACRLVNGESDWLGGLIVDKYGAWCSLQIGFAGLERYRQTIVDTLNETLQPEGIYERSDISSRTKEGLEQKTGLLSGKMPPERLIIDEGLYKFYVDIINGQKTGFFLDQIDNRAAVASVSKGRTVLNCFAYSGGFTIPALAGGAISVESVDISEPALQFCDENIKLNNLDDGRTISTVADVFKYLRTLRDSRKSYDMIVLDPPKFAESRSQMEKAARGYKDINLLAMKLLNPGGILVTFSCSGHITAELFQSIVAGAASDAKKDIQIIQRLYQSADHPVALDYPEGTYLKGLICKAL